MRLPLIPSLALGAACWSPLAAAADDDTAAIHAWPLVESTDLPDGGHRLWLFGLYHRTTTPEGATRSEHVLTWIRSPHFHGLLPVTMGGTGWSAWPPLVTARWHTDDGGTTAWYTPLAHVHRDADGRLRDLEVGPFLEGTDPAGTWQVLPPCWYRTTDCGQLHWGLLPAVVGGDDWWCAPLALSGHWRAEDGSRSTWCTPLVHWSCDADGQCTSWHALTYLQGRDWWAALPAVVHTADAWVAPLALSAHWRSDEGAHSTWVTPAAHWRTDADGHVVAMHVGPYLQARTWGAVVPVAAWGDGWCAVPGLLSGHWRHEQGGATTWITPLLHWTTTAEDSLKSLHVLTYVHAPDGDLLLPVAWRWGDAAHRCTGVLPLWVSTPRTEVLPFLLSLSHQDEDGGRTVVATPLVHWHADAQGTLTHWHAGPVVHTGRTTVVVPVAFRHQGAAGITQAILPLAWQTPRWSLVVPVYAHARTSAGPWSVVFPVVLCRRHDWYAPLALSGTWRTPSGGRTSWLTPLAHRTRAADGSLVGEHCLVAVRTRAASAVVPVWWHWRTASGGSRSVLLPVGVRVQEPHHGSTVVVAPLLSAYHHGETFDRSLGFAALPFSAQSTTAGRELTVLWAFPHLHQERGRQEVRVFPWWSERRAGAPLAWQVLGGLVGRTCNYTRGTSRLRLLWAFPVGRTTHFAPAATSAG